MKKYSRRYSVGPIGTGPLAREHAMRGRIQGDAAELDLALADPPPACAAARPGCGPAARAREGLDHVVVDAGVEPDHPVVLLAARRQHDDGHVPGQALAPHAPRDLDPRRAGQHPVQQHQVGDSFRDGALGLGASGGVHGLEAGAAEGEAEHVADRGLVLDDQDLFLHRSMVAWPPRSRWAALLHDRSVAAA
jgi:hypothetical protein